MNLTTFILKLNAIFTELTNKGINPDTVKLYIHNTLNECVGNIDEVSLCLDISDEEIPYDVHGLDIITEHENLIIIQGE